MPNNTEFIFYNYDTMDKEMKLISEEVDKLGIHGAYKAYSLIRSFAFKKDIFMWLALWKHAGMFVDAIMGWTSPVSDWLDFKNDEYVQCIDGAVFTDN